MVFIVFFIFLVFIVLYWCHAVLWCGDALMRLPPLRLFGWLCVLIPSFDSAQKHQRRREHGGGGGGSDCDCDFARKRDDIIRDTVIRVGVRDEIAVAGLRHAFNANWCWRDIYDATILAHTLADEWTNISNVFVSLSWSCNASISCRHHCVLLCVPYL